MKLSCPVSYLTGNVPRKWFQPIVYAVIAILAIRKLVAGASTITLISDVC